MKSQFQTLSFLSQYAPKTQLDAEMIFGFLGERFKNAKKTMSFCQHETENILDAASLLMWFSNGFGATEIALYNGTIVILGVCTIDNTTIIGKLYDGRINIASKTVKPSELSKATEEDSEAFYKALYASKLQFDQASLTLVKKYIPAPNEKVIFYTNDFSQCGTGVVRSVDESTGDIEMYCYYLYPPANIVGYSMHEKGVANLITHIFEPMLEEDKRSSKMNGVSCLRRMNNELGKRGKVWKDKIRRIEPVSYELEPGKNYWYISDDLKIVQKEDKGTPTSHFRYLAGNYFITKESAEMMKDKITELIQSYLASSDWPNVE
jgi:hypothetical protein